MSPPSTATSTSTTASSSFRGSQGLTFAKRFVADRLAKADPSPVSAVARGEAAIEVDRDKRAVYPGEEGTVHALSPVCTHLGCRVDWNDTDRTWD